MKVPYSEEIANHIDPESCGNRGKSVASGEDVGKGNIDGQLSSENTTNWEPIPWSRCTWKRIVIFRQVQT